MRSLVLFIRWALFLALLGAATTRAETIHETGKHVFPQGQTKIGPLRFADLQLLVPCDRGTTTYCSDCSPTNPCTGGGPGVHARCEGVSSAWICRDIGAGTGTVQTVDCEAGILCTPDPITAAGTLNLDIFSLTTETALADGDWFAFVDVSVGTAPAAQRKVTLANLRVAIQGTTTTTVATTTTTTAAPTTTTTTTVATTTTTTIATPSMQNFRYYSRTQYQGSGVTDTGVISFGSAAASIVTVPTAFQDATGAYVNLATAGSGTNGVVTGPTNHTARILRPVACWTIKTGTVITVARHWFVLSDAAPAAPYNADDPVGVNLMGFRRSTSAGDTNFLCATKDGTTLGTTDSGVAMATDTRYTMCVDASNSAQVDFSINGANVCTRTTNLPVDTASLRFFLGVRTLEATDKSFRFRLFEIGSL